MIDKVLKRLGVRFEALEERSLRYSERDLVEYLHYEKFREYAGGWMIYRLCDRRRPEAGDRRPESRIYRAWATLNFARKVGMA